jgi:hypothetical protein
MSTHFIIPGPSSASLTHQTTILSTMAQAQLDKSFSSVRGNFGPIQSDNKDPDADFLFDRDPDFYTGDHSFKIGQFRVRLYSDTLKYTWLVCFKKCNASYPDSFFKFPSSDIPVLVKTIHRFMKDIKLCSVSEKNRKKFQDTDSNWKFATFWNKQFCAKTPSGQVIVRPYADGALTYTIRMLSPKESSYKDWQGQSVSFGVIHCLEFANLLKRFKKFIDVTDALRLTILEGCLDPDHGGLNRASPTLVDLEL